MSDPSFCSPDDTGQARCRGVGGGRLVRRSCGPDGEAAAGRHRELADGERRVGQERRSRCPRCRHRRPSPFGTPVRPVGGGAPVGRGAATGPGVVTAQCLGRRCTARDERRRRRRRSSSPPRSRGRRRRHRVVPRRASEGPALSASKTGIATSHAALPAFVATGKRPFAHPHPSALCHSVCCTRVAVGPMRRQLADFVRGTWKFCAVARAHDPGSRSAQPMDFSTARRQTA